jgi:hypothetical protein
MPAAATPTVAPVLARGGTRDATGSARRHRNREDDTMRIRNLIAAACLVVAAPLARAEEPAPAMPMHQHMQDMQRSMDELGKATDPAKRDVLLREHMAQMRAGMKDMNAMQGMGMMHDGVMRRSQGSESPDARLDAMRQRQDAMQSMMDQMLQHQEQMMKSMMKH